MPLSGDHKQGSKRCHYEKPLRYLDVESNATGNCAEDETSCNDDEFNNGDLLEKQGVGQGQADVDHHHEKQLPTYDQSETQPRYDQCEPDDETHTSAQSAARNGPHSLLRVRTIAIQIV